MKKAIQIICLVFACLAPNRLFGTAQTPEILILDGKKESMYCEPLESYFEKGHPRPKVFEEPTSTALWRGYIGTWEIKNEELFLKSLERITSIRDEKTWEYKESIDEVPMNIVFPNQKGNIKAVWFSGIIKVPRGKMLRYVHMGFGSVFSKALYLTVKNGRITAKKLVDNQGYGQTRSDADMQWVALAEKPVPDDQNWVDARTILTNPPKGSFKTRGIFFSASGDQTAKLWIPDTPRSEAVYLDLDMIPTPLRIAEGSHIEVMGAIITSSFIRTESIRELKPGETIHQQNYKEVSNPTRLHNHQSPFLNDSP